MAVDDIYTKSLLHCNGADNSNAFIDESGKGWAARGNLHIHTGEKKFGSASGFFDGTGDYITTADSADFAMGTGEFTIDCWINASALGTGYYTIIENREADSTTGFFFGVGNKKLAMLTNTEKITGTTTINNDTWYHVAIVGNGGAAGSRTIKIYLNGGQEGSTYTNDYNFTHQGINVGAYWGLTPYEWKGYMDEIRISQGIQRWTGTFTPQPTAYHPSTNYLHARRDRMNLKGVSTQNILG